MVSENTETNNIMNKKKQPKTEIQHNCQYNYPNCQKIAVGQHILKLGSVTIDKGWIRANCQQVIERERSSK